ncbi:MAG TPA: aspartate--tRNA ligase, partial [Gemmatimonadetes bacterium]|nr:aspartate--tRNA ligase [Gemmatimonadota bacterium]
LSEVAEIDASLPFPRLTWAEAMDRFGSDRPDLRFGLEIEDWTEATASLDFGIVRSAVTAGGRVRGLRLSGGA